MCRAAGSTAQVAVPVFTGPLFGHGRSLKGPLGGPVGPVGCSGHGNSSSSHRG